VPSFAILHDNGTNLYYSNKKYAALGVPLAFGLEARVPKKSMLTKLMEKFKGVNRRLIVALAGYLVLIIIILYAFLPLQTRDDRFILALVLGLFAILIIRTIAHSKNDD
jgi:hypothetical protein